MSLYEETPNPPEAHSPLERSNESCQHVNLNGKEVMEPTDKFISKMNVEMNKIDIEQPSGHMLPQANREGEP